MWSSNHWEQLEGPVVHSRLVVSTVRQIKHKSPVKDGTKVSSPGVRSQKFDRNLGRTSPIGLFVFLDGWAECDSGADTDLYLERQHPLYMSFCLPVSELVSARRNELTLVRDHGCSRSSENYLSTRILRKCWASNFAFSKMPAKVVRLPRHANFRFVSFWGKRLTKG